MTNIQQVELNQKRVLLRADLNVAVENGQISSDERIRAALETIRYALGENAALMVVSHFGRPVEGHYDAEYSLAPVRDAMQKLLGSEVRLLKHWIDGVEIEPGEIVLCENVRFLRGEASCDRKLSQKMGRLCDIFVMDAFGTAHRNHASTCGVTEFAETACLGFLCQREIDSLNTALKDPVQPAVAIVGGAKVQGKLQALSRLSSLVQVLIVGGGIANTFLAAQGINVGRSLFEPQLVPEAQRILDIAEQNGCSIPLPQDVAVANSLDVEDRQQCINKSIDEIDDNDMVLDIGHATQAYYRELIDASNTIIWNGPVGAFEFPPFDAGTREIAAAIANSDAFSLAGGGDTLSAMDRFGVKDRISYASTGGGAFLEYIQGNPMPAFAAMSRSIERNSQQISGRE